MNKPTIRGSHGAIAIACVLLAGVAFGAASWSAPNDTPDKPDSMIGTVRAVDVEMQTLEIVTGVGHAVRVVRMRVAADCAFAVPGAAPRLSSITPGTCVRVDYVAAKIGAPVPRVAVAIEAIAVGGKGKTP